MNRIFFFVAVCVNFCNLFASEVAVVDLKRVASECLVGKDIENQIENLNNEAKERCVALEDQIKAMEKNKIADDDGKKIEEMQQKLYGMIREIQIKISKAYRVAVAQLDAEIKAKIYEWGAQNNVSLVLTNDAVVCNVTVKDITDEIISRVDKDCESIKVELKGEQ